MDHLLDFCAAILLLTGGILVTIFWIGLMILASIEVHDLIKEAYFTPTKNEDDY